MHKPERSKASQGHPFMTSWTKSGRGWGLPIYDDMQHGLREKRLFYCIVENMFWRQQCQYGGKPATRQRTLMGGPKKVWICAAI